MATVVVYHDFYGCMTGCCGHTIEVGDKRRFELGEHPEPDEDLLEYCKDLVERFYGEEHVKDLDWDKCILWTYDDKVLKESDYDPY